MVYQGTVWAAGELGHAASAWRISAGRNVNLVGLQLARRPQQGRFLAWEFAHRGLPRNQALPNGIGDIMDNSRRLPFR